MKFVFIAKHRNIWPVAWLCDSTGVPNEPVLEPFHSGINAAASEISKI